jgi:hypothetical protein
MKLRAFVQAADDAWKPGAFNRRGVIVRTSAIEVVDLQFHLELRFVGVIKQWPVV